MAGKIVDRFLDKVPFSNEIMDVLKDHIDLKFTKQLAIEIVHQVSGQGDKLKKEIASIISKEIQKEFNRVDKSEILQKALEGLEITISFKKK
jgi:16S rRNA C1402 N4-methylase RsmH